MIKQKKKKTANVIDHCIRLFMYNIECTVSVSVVKR